LRLEKEEREQGESIRVYFVLPKGAYATTVISAAVPLDEEAGKCTDPLPLKGTLIARTERSKPMGNNEIIERVKNAMVGAGAAWVLWLMLILSIVSLAIMLERAWLYYSLRDDVGSLMRELGKLLRSGDLEGARKRLESSPSAEPRWCWPACGGDLRLGLGRGSDGWASALQKTKLEKRLAYLGTLGNNAPFIGLLGTVIASWAPFRGAREIACGNTGGAAAGAANAAANAAAAAASTWRLPPS